MPSPNTRKYKCSVKDLIKLNNEISLKNCSQLVIYGCGANGGRFLGYLKSLGVNVSYFVDKTADGGAFTVLGKKVISPNTFIKNYVNETVLISPDIHYGIYMFLKENNIPEENIIIPFSCAEGEVYLGTDLLSPSLDIRYCKEVSKSPEVTVFSIVYNTPPHMLRRAIESVLRQTSGNLSYLIIDNGSTDDSNKIMSEYASLDKRIKLVRMTENIINWSDEQITKTLSDNITGSYVCQCDADDYFMPDYLGTAMNAARKSNADIIHINMLRYTEDGYKYDSLYSGFTGDKLFKESEIIEAYGLGLLYPNPFGYFCRAGVYRSFLRKIGDMPHMLRNKMFSLDVSWTFEILSEAHGLLHIDNPLYVYTLRNGSSTAEIKNKRERLLAIYYTYKQMKDILKKNDKPEIYADIFCDVCFAWLLESGVICLDTESGDNDDLTDNVFRNILEDDYISVALHENPAYRGLYSAPALERTMILGGKSQ